MDIIVSDKFINHIFAEFYNPNLLQINVYMEFG